MRIDTTRLAALLVVAGAVGVACSYSSASPPGAGLGGAGQGGVDYEGSTGSGDDEVNSDLEGEEDTEDPSKPECEPGAIVDADGNCIPSCVESGNWCADDGAPTDCDGFPPVESHDCMVCCEIPEGEEPPCPPEGCVEPGCEPPDDPACVYTDTCPDAVCDVAAGEDCASCPDDCNECPESCGDTVCSEGFETCLTCAEDCDCPPTCGDGICDLDAAATGIETCENCPDDCGRCVKVLSWDISAGLKKGKGKVGSTLKSIANRIKAQKPNYVGLQTVDKNTKRSGNVDEALVIAKRAKMYKRFGGAFNYNGGQYGVAFLSKHKIIGMEKQPMATSGEWAKRRILYTASLELDDYYVLFHLGVTQLARSAGSRLAQAKTIATDLGFEADAILVGDLYDVAGSPAIEQLQKTGSLLDLWPDYGTGGNGFTYGNKRIDYTMAAFNWWNPEGGGDCAFVVRNYTIPAKGLSSHKPVIAVLQRGLGGADCGQDGGSGDLGADDIGFDDEPCASDAECVASGAFPFCIGGYCSECKSNADCIEPEFPTCLQNECF